MQFCNGFILTESLSFHHGLFPHHFLPQYSNKFFTVHNLNFDVSFSIKKFLPFHIFHRLGDISALINLNLTYWGKPANFTVGISWKFSNSRLGGFGGHSNFLIFIVGKSFFQYTSDILIHLVKALTTLKVKKVLFRLTLHLTRCHINPCCLIFNNIRENAHPMSIFTIKGITHILFFIIFKSLQYV